MYTTLNKIRAHNPCRSGWEKLLRNLGKKKADDEPLAITTILDSNGIDDALWCLRAVDGHQREMRLFAVDCARSVQHLMADPRSLVALDVAERHADGLATDNELADAWAAVLDDAWAAAWAAARDAALAAVLYDAWAAAWAAARDAALAAVLDDARDAAWDAARDAALAAVLDDARDAAWDAAWAAAREVQADLLRIICAEVEQRDALLD